MTWNVLYKLTTFLSKFSNKNGSSYNILFRILFHIWERGNFENSSLCIAIFYLWNYPGALPQSSPTTFKKQKQYDNDHKISILFQLLLSSLDWEYCNKKLLVICCYSYSYSYSNIYIYIYIYIWHPCSNSKEQKLSLVAFWVCSSFIDKFSDMNFNVWQISK